MGRTCLAPLIHWPLIDPLSRCGMWQCHGLGRAHRVSVGTVRDRWTWGTHLHYCFLCWGKPVTTMCCCCYPSGQARKKLYPCSGVPRREEESKVVFFGSCVFRAPFRQQMPLTVPAAAAPLLRSLCAHSSSQRAISRGTPADATCAKGVSVAAEMGWRPFAPHIVIRSRGGRGYNRCPSLVFSDSLNAQRRVGQSTHVQGMWHMHSCASTANMGREKKCEGMGGRYRNSESVGPRALDL